MSNEIKIATPQFERTWELDYDFIPQTEDEFHKVIQNAPIDTLVGMGFGRWNTIKSIVTENNSLPVSKKVSIPIAASLEDALKGEVTEQTMEFDMGRGGAPTVAPEQDAWILLFPGEWYNKIPNGFMVTGLSGEQYAFENGVSDDDTRFGCLPYGILKPIQ